MLNGYRVYDADAHARMSPRMWEELPEEYVSRRPRPVRISDTEGLGFWTTAWLLEGRIRPTPFGPGAQSANMPGMTMEEYRANIRATEFSFPVCSIDLSDPNARLEDLDRMGIDVQVVIPATPYAHMTADPGFEAALFRCYNRYMGKQCKSAAKRLKWTALLPLRHQREAFAAIEEMKSLGASAAVVYGTAGENLLSDPSIMPIWDEFYRTGLPLCVHMGMSYPPFEQLCQTIHDSNLISKAMPAQFAFVALVSHGMLDRYPDLKVAFLEFGAEWLFYMYGRMDHYIKVNKLRMPSTKGLPFKDMEAYLKSGRIFVAAEADDSMMVQEMALLGEDQILYSSDFPHDEGRDRAGGQILERSDLSNEQKRKILYDNTVKLFGEP